jgi:hypothetical protein
MKIKYVLPVVQIAIVALLLRWNDFLSIAARRCDMPGPSPADRLLMSINAPLVFQLRLWYDAFPYPWRVAVQIGAVSLFWYWIAVNISSWRRGGSMVTPSWGPLRVAIDLGFVLLGLAFGLQGLSSGRDVLRYGSYLTSGVGCFGPNLWCSFLPSIAVVCLRLGWSFVLVYFCGRDLGQYTSSGRSE